MVARKVEYRSESDDQGEMPVPAMSYWGIGTARALEFGRTESMNVRFLQALVLLRKAAAEANLQLGKFEVRIAKAISMAADEVLAGQLHDQFPVSLLQAGAQIFVCLNVDEVLANRAAETLGATIGQYDVVHPSAHVAFMQSPYDSFPLALRIALLKQKSEVEACLLDLERLLRRKALEFDKVVKPGRVHLQDALPVSLGQVFNSWGSSIGRCYKRLNDVTTLLSEIAPGCGEVGTGFGASREFAVLVVEKLSAFSGLKLRLAEDAIRAQQSMSDYVALSSVFKEIAVELQKICSDLCLMSSGPRAGLNEISLPTAFVEKSHLNPLGRAVPIVPEFGSMLCMQVLGNNLTLSVAAQTGQLEHNAMLPLIASNLLFSSDALVDALNLMTKRCIAGLSADSAHCQEKLAATNPELALLTAYFGQARAKQLEDEAHGKSISLRELIISRQLMTPEQYDRTINVKMLLTQSSTESAATRR